MLKGTIVENSLRDKSILENIEIVKTWKSDDWTLHEVRIMKDAAMRLAEYMDEGPWYIHFWQDGSDDILVVFKNKTYTIKGSDKRTWADCVKYGQSVGIPIEQLDFKIV